MKEMKIILIAYNKVTQVLNQVVEHQVVEEVEQVALQEILLLQ